MSELHSRGGSEVAESQNVRPNEGTGEGLRPKQSETGARSSEGEINKETQRMSEQQSFRKTPETKDETAGSPEKKKDNSPEKEGARPEDREKPESVEGNRRKTEPDQQAGSINQGTRKLGEQRNFKDGREQTMNPKEEIRPDGSSVGDKEKTRDNELNLKLDEAGAGKPAGAMEQDTQKMGEQPSFKKSEGQAGNPKELTPNGNLEKQYELTPYMRETYQKAVDNEKKISPDVKSAVEDSGGKMAGYENRLKTEDSFARKVNTDIKEQGVSEKEAVDNIGDNVRYTSLSDSESLRDNYSKVTEELKDKGYDITKVKNTWDDETNPYKGVNVSTVSPEGQKFEIQFHTPESYDAKQRMHAAYEEYRLPETSNARRQELTNEMNDISASLERPKDIEEVK